MFELPICFKNTRAVIYTHGVLNLSVVTYICTSGGEVITCAFLI